MATIDFSKFQPSTPASSNIVPRDLFASLTKKSPKFEYLRDVQREVLDQWHERRQEHDLTIKMNTGNGKTVVGLLLLQSSLNEGVGPAAYFTADNYLADQVRATAVDLGLSITDDPRNAQFTNSRAILITNIYRLFNGSSVFGVGDDGQRISIGTIIVDDAHACLNIVDRQYTISLSASTSPYREILNLLKPELEPYYPVALLDLDAKVGGVTLQVPPWLWYDNRIAILQILHSYKDEPELKWTWPLVSSAIPISRAIFTSSSLDIVPVVPPIESIPSFLAAQRRIYLTATLADDSILVSHFGASPDSVDKPISPKSADDIGDRMILVPQQIQPLWSDETVKELVGTLSKRLNVAVLVPSAERAKWWSDIAQNTVTAENIADVMPNIGHSSAGLNVFVGKYDGVDLPEDMCRILVLDGIPEFRSGIEKLEGSLLGQSRSQRIKLMQRVEQGMGRGIRSRNDFCVVILMGRSLVQYINQPDSRSMLSPATAGQMEISQFISEQITSNNISDLLPVINMCLERTENWVDTSRGALVGISYGQANIRGAVPHIRRAFDLASQSRFQEACDSQLSAIRATTDTFEKGWLRQQLAAYTHPFNRVDAQAIQRRALDENRRLVFANKNAHYVRPNAPSVQQAELASSYLRAKYSTARDLQIGVHSILEELVFNPDHSKVEGFESALYEIGLHLGFVASRPEKEASRGPDVLWRQNDGRIFVFEAKSAAVTDFISKHDINQLSGSLNWATAEFGQQEHFIPLLVHPSCQLHFLASELPNAKSITTSKLDSFKRSFMDFTTAIAAEFSDGSFPNINRVRQILEEHSLLGGTIPGRFASAIVPSNRR